MSPSPPRGGRRGDVQRAREHPAPNPEETDGRQGQAQAPDDDDPRGRARRRARADRVGCRGRGGIPVELRSDTLQPVEIGQNSFVFAATARSWARSLRRTTAPRSGSGGSPPGRGRRPSRSRTAASTSTAASTTRGSRAPPRGHQRRPGRAGRLDDHTAARAEPLPLQGADASSARSRRHVSRSSSPRWSKDRILDEYMNQVFYGNHAYGIEAAAQTYFSNRRGTDARAGGAHRRLAAGAVGLRPVHRPAAALRGATGAERDAVKRRHHLRPSTRRRSPRKLGSPGKLYIRIREPYFFSYVATS